MSSDIVDGLIEMCRTAPDLCPSCKYLEDESLERIEWDRWCSKLVTPTTRVWLCTTYEQLPENEE